MNRACLWRKIVFKAAVKDNPWCEFDHVFFLNMTGENKDCDIRISSELIHVKLKTQF